MLQLIYVSTAVKPMQYRDLLDLLSASRARNRREAITGLLLYREGCFIQLLEGPEPAVRDCYRRISGDARHKWVLQLMTAPTLEHEFPNWAMGFHDLANLTPEMQKNLAPFLSESFAAPLWAAEPSFAQRLLLEFRNAALPNYGAA